MNRFLSTIANNVKNNNNNNLSLSLNKLPKLAVFDLDHTVWPFGIDAYYYIPPYYYYENKLIDTNGNEIKHFPDFPEIFKLLQENNIKIGVASRTKFPNGALRLIKLFDWEKYIQYYHIYPGQKIKHFERIRQESNVDYNEMIFFDDEQRNIIDIESLGVNAILVNHDSGATKQIVLETLSKFSFKTL